MQSPADTNFLLFDIIKSLNELINLLIDQLKMYLFLNRHHKILHIKN